MRFGCFFGRHKNWKMIAPLRVEIPDGIRITWSGMQCIDCGDKRYENRLKPGETIHFEVGEFFLTEPLEFK